MCWIVAILKPFWMCLFFGIPALFFWFLGVPAVLQGWLELICKCEKSYRCCSERMNTMTSECLKKSLFFITELLQSESAPWQACLSFKWVKMIVMEVFAVHCQQRVLWEGLEYCVLRPNEKWLATFLIARNGGSVGGKNEWHDMIGYKWSGVSVM